MRRCCRAPPWPRPRRSRSRLRRVIRRTRRTRLACGVQLLGPERRLVCRHCRRTAPPINTAAVGTSRSRSRPGTPTAPRSTSVANYQVTEGGRPRSGRQRPGHAEPEPRHADRVHRVRPGRRQGLHVHADGADPLDGRRREADGRRRQRTPTSARWSTAPTRCRRPSRSARRRSSCRRPARTRWTRPPRSSSRSPA